jgi:hypothetical protein
MILDEDWRDSLLLLPSIRRSAPSSEATKDTGGPKKGSKVKSA